MAATEKEIKAVIMEFQANPIYQRFFRHPAQRDACIRLIETYGVNAVIRGAKAAWAANGKLYAPTITTPYMLETKWAQLVAYYRREQSGKPGRRVWNVDELAKKK